jgi:hypothetical protein
MKQEQALPCHIRKDLWRESIMRPLKKITVAYYFGGLCAMIGEREK